MKHLLGSLATLSALLGVVMIAAIGATSTDVPVPVKFGMEASAIDPQKAAGVAADYGSIWVGPWTLKSGGWNGPDAELQKMSDAGVTPAIHLYYWGDDISPSCVENGCWSSLHGAWKNREGWEALGQQLTDHLQTKMGGKPVMIFLESEFNKGGIESYEPFDGYMATMAANIRADYPSVQLVLAFGNWGHNAWANFDRAAAASDFTGVQSMRGSTRDTYDNYGTMYESIVSASTKLKNTFGKPIVLTDLALSSYPETPYLKYQADTLAEVFQHLGELKALGVGVIIYRSWYDSPGMDTANWYGEAERHWGLVYAANKTYKPAAHVWIKGVKAERASAATAPSSSSSGTFSATFEPVSQNEWWVEVKVTSSSTVSKVEARANGGAWNVLAFSERGTWAKSFNVPKGSSVVFKATSPSGATATSAPFTWMATSPSPAPTTASTATSSPSSSAFTATFTPVSQNEWWVEVRVSASTTVSKVEAQSNGGAWHVLAATQYGTWAKSFNVPRGSSVVFKATSASGQTATSAPMSWMGTEPSATTSPSASPSTSTGTTSASTSSTASTTSEPSTGGGGGGGGGGWYPTTSSSSSTPTRTTSSTPTSPSAATSSTSSARTTAPLSSISTLIVTFSPRQVGNDHWVETGVSCTAAIAKVEARDNGGAWFELPKTNRGTYGELAEVPDGHEIEFRATTGDGRTVTSGVVVWT